VAAVCLMCRKVDAVMRLGSAMCGWVPETRLAQSGDGSCIKDEARAVGLGALGSVVAPCHPCAGREHGCETLSEA